MYSLPTLISFNNSAAYKARSKGSQFMAGFAALLRWLLVFLNGMAHNERLSLFHQNMSDNPIPPSIADGATVEIRQFFCHLGPFVESCASLLWLVQLMLGHGQHRVRFHKATCVRGK